MPKTTKKVTKKSPVKKTVSKSVPQSGNQSFMLGLVLVVMAIVVGPLVWYVTGNVLAIFVVPALSSFVVAFIYNDVVGSEMSYEFRRTMTTVISVLGIAVASAAAVQLPRVGLLGQEDKALPIFMIVYYSVWAIITTLVTVFLPLGVTIPKKK